MDTVTLLAVISRLVGYDTFLLNLMFPNVVTFDTESIAFDEIFQDHTLAPFVSPLVAGKANTMQGGVAKSFKPAYVKPKDALNPGRVLKRRPGEAYGGSLSAAQRRDAIVVDILDSQRQRIINRMEWMAAQLLRTGKIIVKGENYPEAEVDFGRAANHTVTLTSTARWGESAENPKQDLDVWMDRLDAPCTHIVMGNGAFSKFVKNPEIKELIETRRGSDTQLELAPAVMKATFRGRLGGGGPEIWTYSGWYVDEAGAKKKYIEDNQVVLMSQGATGVRAHGAILDKQAGYQALEFFPKVWDENDPSVEYCMTQSAPLPVLPLINSTLCANVYTL